MEFINESDSDVYRKKMKMTSSSDILMLQKEIEYIKETCYNSDPTTLTDSDPAEDQPDCPANYIPHLSDPENSTKELPDNQTAESPQDSGESVVRPEIESPDSGPETNLVESSKEDSIMDTSEASAMETFESSTAMDTKRTRRNSKRKKEVDECCPVCGITVRVPELQAHLAQEIEKLDNIPKRFRKPSRNYDGVSNTYVQVKSNRANRLTAKVAQYAAKAQKEVQCPICKIRMTGSVEEINDHVVLCAETDDPVYVDDEDDSSYEEYDFGDETRIRAISLVPGGYRSLQGQSHQTRGGDIDGDVEVDVDDTMSYGQPQYTELDIISNHAQDRDEACEQLRKAVADPSAQPKVLESRKWCNSIGEKEEMEASVNQCEKSENDDSTVEEKEDSLSNQVISSLKEKIKDLEDQNKDVKCLICLETYTKPVVSTTCWHVHCEECWLMTMGVKKLCPQCNMIVFPSDLRKIYL